MEKENEEYKIKGVEKILEKASREDLAKYYEVDINSDFEKIITESFKEDGIPNNSEIALYVALTQEEVNQMRKEGKSTNPMDIASEFYEQDERKRAMYGLDYRISNKTEGDVLYFYVDEPIREEVLLNMIDSPRYFVGGCHYHGLIMGNKYYEEHKSELEASLPDESKIKAVENYIENFFNEFEDVEYVGGYGPKPKYKETDQIKKEKAENEKIILELTGKNSIDEISLRDFINIKRRLEKEEQDLQQQFEEKFTQKIDGER